MTPSPTLQPDSPSTTENAWHFFEQVYCINLATRPDRKLSAERAFKNAGLAPCVQFHTVEKHPTHSEQGIYESHIACLRQGLAKNAQTILIFEDDIELAGFSAQALTRATEFLRSTPDWSVFFLGGFVDQARKTSTPHVAKIKYRCSAHAYAVTREFAQKLVAIPWTGKPYDIMLRDLSLGRTYFIYPAFAYQSSSPTDNDRRRAIDRVRRLIGGQRLLQRWNLFSTLYFRHLVVIHVLIVLAMVLFAIVAHRGHWFRHEPLDFLLKRNGN